MAETFLTLNNAINLSGCHLMLMWKNLLIKFTVIANLYLTSMCHLVWLIVFLNRFFNYLQSLKISYGHNLKSFLFIHEENSMFNCIKCLLHMNFWLIYRLILLNCIFLWQSVNVLKIIFINMQKLLQDFSQLCYSHNLVPTLHRI